MNAPRFTLPLTAMLDLTALANLGGYKGALPELLQQWAERDPAAARQWTESLPAGEVGDELAARVAWVPARPLPDGAASRVAAPH